MFKKVIIVSVLTVFMFFSNLNGNVIDAMTYYEKLDFVTGIVTAGALNVRCGPRNKL